MVSTDLLKKYNVPGPRYTSYPSVPFWDSTPSESEWISSIKKGMQEGISLYIHLPFCESMCTYCGCHKVLTKNHDVESDYVSAVLNEWKWYISRLGDNLPVTEVHLGGGTPTFFSSESLKTLMNGILKDINCDNPELSIEAHPGYTSVHQLETLRDLGFQRVSFGIQDFDEVVQAAINRPQSFAEVQEMTEAARKLGFSSVNYDLIYGLPKQTLNSINKTMGLVNQLKPDRIAFYSYAHVPWKSRMQRTFSDDDLPTASEKFNLYQTGRKLLEDAGYLELGMDHFSLPSDGLFEASIAGKLNRNFMGYTTTDSRVLIGLGASSISDSWTAFHQNEKNVWKYIDQVNAGELPTLKGHQLTPSDLQTRKYILDIMCRLQTELSGNPDLKVRILSQGDSLIQDGCMYVEEEVLHVTKTGQSFLRNIAMLFDEYLQEKQPSKPMFSQTI